MELSGRPGDHSSRATEEMITRLYIADVTELEEDRLYHAAYQKAACERQRKVDALHFPRDRQLSLGVELLLQYALGQLGLPCRDMIYSYKEGGKPYLVAQPDIHFSLSHSGKIAICAISSGETGCDVEEKKRFDMKIAERFFTREEYQQIVKQESDQEKQEMFSRLWTLKESFIKATGLGLRIPLDSFCIIFGGNGQPLPLQHEGQTYFFQEFAVHPDYKCSICLQEGCCSRPALLEHIPLSKILSKT